MDFEIDEHIEAVRAETREFIRQHLTPEMVEEAHRTGTKHDWAFHRAIAGTGIIAEGIGGASSSGRDPLEMHAIFDELGLADVPFYGLANTMLVAGVIDQLGSDFHRREVLPRLHRGEAIVAFGYTEPDAGSDLASLTTRAVQAEDGTGDWVIDGQKMFTTFAHEAGYVILLTRTDPEVAKHRGLTMFLVPMDTPGIEVQAVHTMGDDRTNVTFFTDVRIGDEWRLGDVNRGWHVMTTALAYERGVLGNTNQGVTLLDRFARWAATAEQPDGSVLLDDPDVRARLARIAIDNEVTTFLSVRSAAIASSGGQPAVEGALTKLYATDSYGRAAAECQAMAGPWGLVSGPDGAVDGLVDLATRDAPVTKIYGGTSEIQRNLVAERRLGLPKAR